MNRWGWTLAGVALVGLLSLGLVGGFTGGLSHGATPASAVGSGVSAAASVQCATPSVTLYYSPGVIPMGQPFQIHAALYYPAWSFYYGPGTTGSTSGACFAGAVFTFTGPLVPNGHLVTANPAVLVPMGENVPGNYVTTVSVAFGAFHVGGGVGPFASSTLTVVP
jgi:hypothetical protein